MCRALLSDSEKPTVFIKFNVDGLLRGDYESRMSGYATARQNGWMSANDIRELENLDRIPAEAWRRSLPYQRRNDQNYRTRVRSQIQKGTEETTE